VSVIAWESSVDVVVVGSGVAGLTAALDAAAAGRSVLMIAKGRLDDANTSWAQGGVAVVRDERDPHDSVDAHIQDTLVAGAGLCDPVAVATIIGAGPAAIRRLSQRGAIFDRGPAGLLRTREGGHSADRVIHAGGDATGAEIERALLAARSAAHPAPAVLADHLVTDVVLDERGRAAGVIVLDEQARIGVVRAAAVVLATGGAGHLFATTTNPAVATADGVAMALRAGAVTADLEFVQFHPTMLWTGPGSVGHQPLVTEAVRGAGAVLVDATGARVMAGVHPLADLAPRDVVSLAVTRRLAAAPGGVTDHVFLDATAIPARVFAERFPTVLGACRAIGVDPSADPIPVAPAAHFHCGGVATDLAGRTSVPGLWAVGEVAGAGLHGANRLASNSLLEGLVMGERAAAALCRELNGRESSAAPGLVLELPTPSLVDARGRVALQEAMSAAVGIGREADGLGGVGALAHGLRRRLLPASTPPTRAGVEVANLALVSAAVVAAAAARQESIGCHVRTDVPAPRPLGRTPRSHQVTLVDDRLHVDRVLTGRQRAAAGDRS
jgi:L-aspartate oxidase